MYYCPTLHSSSLRQAPFSPHPSSPFLRFAAPMHLQLAMHPQSNRHHAHILRAAYQNGQCKLQQSTLCFQDTVSSKYVATWHRLLFRINTCIQIVGRPLSGLGLVGLVVGMDAVVISRGWRLLRCDKMRSVQGASTVCTSRPITNRRTTLMLSRMREWHGFDGDMYYCQDALWRSF
jgi:hypothetical protein